MAYLQNRTNIPKPLCDITAHASVLHAITYLTGILNHAKLDCAQFQVYFKNDSSSYIVKCFNFKSG